MMWSVLQMFAERVGGGVQLQVCPCTAFKLAAAELVRLYFKFPSVRQWGK